MLSSTEELTWPTTGLMLLRQVSWATGTVRERRDIFSLSKDFQMTCLWLFEWSLVVGNSTVLPKVTSVSFSRSLPFYGRTSPFKDYNVWSDFKGKPGKTSSELEKKFSPVY